MDNEKEVKSGVETLFAKEMEAIKAANTDIESVIVASEGPREKPEEKMNVEQAKKPTTEEEKELISKIMEPKQYRLKVLELVELRLLLSYSQLINLIKCGLLVLTIDEEKYSIIEPAPGSMISSMMAFNNTRKLDFVGYIKAIETYKESNNPINALQYIRTDITANEVKEYFK